MLAWHHSSQPRPFAAAQPEHITYEVLRILWEGPQNGYDITLALKKQRRSRSGPGAVYPALQMLEEGGFISGRLVERTRVYTIADAGSELLAVLAAV